MNQAPVPRRETPPLAAEFRAAIESPRPERSRSSGRPVVGYFCSYVPPELLLAAGLDPLRLRGLGVEDSSSGDAYLSHLTCSFARQVTAAVLDGVYDFLAGQISVNCCDHLRRANDVLVAKSRLSYHGYLSVPHSFRPDLLAWYLEELARLKDSLEDHFQVQITEAALQAATAQTNRVRERMQKLDALRRGAEPKLSGADLLTAAVAARVLPPDRFVEKADALLAAARSAEPVPGIRSRVILIGGELDDPRYLRTLESQGAHVAGDLLCFGSRGLGLPVETGGPPLEALARAYLYQTPCARMMDEFPRRYQTMVDLFQECGARGIIFTRIKFCQIWANEVHNLRHRLETNPLPLLVLEREYGTVSSGQIKTRVQAFLERLERAGGQP
jgi:benzoyl-CoA reductase/2-hydroxyglutaryl-CoA dehydratase subunit BcrC/BadD/HgdB